MTLREMIDSDSLQVFCNESEFAEQVTYHPYCYLAGDDRTERVIVANVFRDRIRQDDENPNSVLPAFEVHVHNNATTGISSDEIDTGGDQISFAVRVGETATRRSIVRITDHDHGMMVIECR